MKSLGGNFKPEERKVDMHDMNIANMNEDCSRCEVKGEGCEFKKNTLKCLMTKRRFKKALDEAREKEDEVEAEDMELAEESAQSVKDFLSSIPTEEELEKDTEDDD